MKRWIFGSIAVLVLLACGFVAFAFFSSNLSAAEFAAAVRARFTNGQRELQRSLEAKKAARSFRMKTVLRLHPGRAMETLTEVSCPDRERITTSIGERTFHAVRLGSQAFVEQPDGSWEAQSTSANGWSPCGEAAGEPAPWATMNEGRDLTVVLATIAKHATISRGQFVATDAGSCQEWILTIQHPGGSTTHGGGAGMKYTICIDPKQHLPVRIVMGSGGMVVNYYDWDRPIQIEAPKT